jgi:DNA-directed RNA polymerase subunit K/omega
MLSDLAYFIQRRAHQILEFDESFATIKKNDDDIDFALINFINRKINQNERSRDSLLI